MSCTLWYGKRQTCPILDVIFPSSAGLFIFNLALCLGGGFLPGLILSHVHTTSFFSFIHNVKQADVWPKGCSYLFLTSSFVMWSLYKMFKILCYYLISRASKHLWRSAVRNTDLQVYGNIEISVYMNLIFDVREMFLSCHMVFSFINIAVEFPILARNSGFDPSFQMVASIDTCTKSYAQLHRNNQNLLPHTHWSLAKVLIYMSVLVVSLRILTVSPVER